MKTVFSNAEVCHVWANHGQDYGRNHNGSIFFRGRTIYSYGHHFPMAKIHDGAILVTNRTYSVTTSGHMSHVASAIPGFCDVIRCYDPTGNDHTVNIEDYKKSIESALESAEKARTKTEHYLNLAQIKFNYYKEYCKLFEIEFTYEMPTMDKIKEKVKAQKEAKRKEEEIRRKAEQERKDFLYFHLEHLIEQLHITRTTHLSESDFSKEIIAQFRVYGINWKTIKFITGFDYLFLSDEEVRTTSGASVPIEHAKIMLSRLDSGKEIVGHKIGYYVIRTVSEDSIKIGCHNIPMTEVDWLREVL